MSGVIPEEGSPPPSSPPDILNLVQSGPPLLIEHAPNRGTPTADPPYLRSFYFLTRSTHFTVALCWRSARVCAYIYSGIGWYRELATCWLGWHSRPVGSLPAWNATLIGGLIGWVMEQAVLLRPKGFNGAGCVPEAEGFRNHPLEESGGSTANPRCLASNASSPSFR